MTRRKRIKISGTTPAEQELVEKIEQHLAIPLYDGVPGDRVVLKPGINIKQTAWAKNNAPKALTDIQFATRYLGDGGMTLTSTSPGRMAWAQMMTEKSKQQQEALLKELNEQNRVRDEHGLGLEDTLQGLPLSSVGSAGEKRD